MMILAQVIHIVINPGETYDYSLPIPDYVSPGIYWWHPHLTGHTESAIQGGASGPIVVMGLEAQEPAVAGHSERVFMLRDQLLPAVVANDTDAPSWYLLSHSHST